MIACDNCQIMGTRAEIKEHWLHFSNSHPIYIASSFSCQPAIAQSLDLCPQCADTLQRRLEQLVRLFHRVPTRPARSPEMAPS